jgi:hypothetical protein
MDKAPPSTDAVKVARDAFRMSAASEQKLVSYALGVMKLRNLASWPYSKTRLLLQAAHQVNTKT